MKSSPSSRVASLTAALLLSACSTFTMGDDKGKGPDITGNGGESMQAAAELKKKGELPAAANMYRQLAVEQKISVDALLELAAIDRTLDKGDEAVAAMQEAQARQPENPAVLTQLGYALMDAGHPEESVATFDKLIALDPSNASAYNGKGVAFDRAGNHLAAQELYKLALQITPESAAYQNNMAMSLILNHQYDQAIAILEKLHLQTGDNKTVRQNLALAYGLKGQDDKALALNMKDLSADDAKENLRFYEKYSRKTDELKVSDPHGKMAIGFTETPPEDKPVAKKTKPAKVAKAPKIEEPVKKDVATDTIVPPAKPKAAAKKTIVKKDEAPVPELSSPAAGTAETPAAEAVKAEEPTLVVIPGGTQLPTSSNDAPSDYPSQKRR